MEVNREKKVKRKKKTKKSKDFSMLILSILFLLAFTFGFKLGDIYSAIDRTVESMISDVEK